MSRTSALLFAVLSASTAFAVSACSSGDVPVGSNESSAQELKKRPDGGPTGNGTTCSWDTPVNGGGTVGSGGGAVGGGGAGTSPPGPVGPPTPASPTDPVSAPNPGSPSGPSTVGQSFPSPDGCNTCTCTVAGIMCTMMACQPPPACTEEAKQCPDGSFVARTGPNCEFAPCPGPGPIACSQEAKLCPDGSYVGRTGPSCEFAPCPIGICPADAKLCADGTSVSRTGPGCTFPACP